MKQKRNLLILIVVMVLVCAGYYGATAYTSAKEAAAAVDEILEELENTIYITNLEEEIVGISWTGEEDTYLEFQLVDEEWQYVEDTSIPIDESYIDSAVSTFTNIVAVRELVGGDSLADYGLEDAVYTITLTDTTGVDTVYYIGNAADDNYYLTINDKTNIYTVSSDAYSAIAYVLTDLVEVPDFPVVTSDLVENVVITVGEEETTLTADDEGAFDNVASGLSALDFSTCVDANATGNLEAYGLDEENRTVWYIEYEAFDATLYWCAYGEEDTTYYVQVEGSNQVYTVEEDTILMLLNEYVSEDTDSDSESESTIDLSDYFTY